MNGKQHLVSGASTAALVYSGVRVLGCSSVDVIAQMSGVITERLFSYPWYGMALGAVLYGFGLLLPDIDHEHNSIGVHVPIEQRTWFHTAYAVMVLLIPGVFVRVLLCLAAGYFVHLFWDSFSKCGIAWFKPRSGYRRYPGGAKIKRGFHLVLYTNDVTAWILCCGLAALSSALLVWVHMAL